MAGYVKYCYKCPNMELTDGKMYYMCGGKNCKVQVPKENALKYLEMQVDSMIYCFVCGCELKKAKAGAVLCVDGCGLKVERASSSEYQSDTDGAMPKVRKIPYR